MLDPSQISKKIDEYEAFLNETLKRDLLEAKQKLDERIKKYKEWEEVIQVTKTLKEFKEKDRDMSVRVGIGSGVTAMGEVRDYERVFINIGLGCVLEMDNTEAEKYAEIRLKALKREIDHFRDVAVKIKVNIKMVLLAIGELQTFK